MNWIKKALCAVVLGLAYLAIFVWFRSHDVWNVSANVPTDEMLVWTTLRLFFIVCLGAICLTTGRIVLLGQTQHLRDFGALEKVLVFFFVGSSMLRMGMFFIGLHGLYKPLFVFLGSLPLLLLFPFVFDMRLLSGPCLEVVKRSVLENMCIGGLCLIAAVILGIVYLGHCQYSFDEDYLTHYGPYYANVIKNGGLAPNDVWYQYFYSKGAGLFYFSMLITDRTGPLLVSFLFLEAASLLVYAIIKRVSGSSLWATSAAIFMLGMMAWPNAGFFIKHHCEISAMLLSITAAVVLMSASKLHRHLFFAAASLMLTSLLLYSLQVGAYILMFTGAYAGIAIYGRDRALAVQYGALLGLAAIVSALVMGHNYFVTGLLEITPFRIFLNFWNQEIFSKWVSPYLMFYVSEGSSSEFGTLGIPGAGQSILAYGKLLHLEKFFFSRMFWAVFALVYALGFWGAYRRESLKRKLALNGPGPDDTFVVGENSICWIMLPSVIMCLLVLLVYASVRQSISILRLSEFASLFVTLIVFSTLIACSSLILRMKTYRVVSIFVPVILSLAVCFWTIDHSRDGKVKTPLKFALGMLTANELAPVNKNLRDQYPKIRAIAGEGSRIVSLNLSVDYGPLFLQNPGIITEVSYAFGNRFHEIVFGDPDFAKKTFQGLGINYFLVNLGAPMFGALPYSPLFTGQSLAANFRIVWQLGSRYLLTWNNGQKSLERQFLLEWGRGLRRGMPSTIKGTADYGQNLYDRVLYLYELNHHSLHGIVRPNNLEEVEGWQ